MTTTRELEFYPRRVIADKPEHSRLEGAPIVVPAGTQVELETVIANRKLVKTTTPELGYRFALHGEIT